MTRAEGIDVSAHQGNTPSLVGRSFLFARAAIGTRTDQMYAEHAGNARRAGLVVGAYLFTYDDHPLGEQVETFLRATEVVTPDLYAIDVEGAHAPSHAQTASLVARIQSAGRHVGLYHSDSGYFDAGQDWSWVANWSRSPSHAWDFHQYRGAPLDLDRFRGTEAELRAFAAVHAPDTGVDPPMHVYATPKIPTTAMLAKGVVLYPSDALDPHDPNRIILSPGRAMPYLGNPAPGVSIVNRTTEAGVPTGEVWYIHSADVGAQSPIPGDCSAVTAERDAYLGRLRKIKPLADV